MIEWIRSLDTCVLQQDNYLRRDLQSRCEAVNRRDIEAWAQIKSKGDWEKFCSPRIEALRQSLGIFPSAPGNLKVDVTGVIEADGYRIENLVYESRQKVYVTANLYMPSLIHGKMPAIIIVHSHHNPKTQGELQDMGMTWARTGCMVLVMDQLSYGERRQHSPGPRQDYRFRYINGIQLYLIGDSLMGWMVWDVMRGIDMLLSRNDVDKGRIILIGSVAGGGDIAAVTAAIDKRVTCVIPFNFGGPQPETQYPLSEDAERTFNYMGYGSWESTRNLRLSGCDGFLPWVIVASVAPRYLIYAHEFSWDRKRDPVWKRLKKIYEFYDASDRLAYTYGAGVLSGQPPEATHCNNVGPVHRKMIYPALERWFDMTIPQEYQNRLPEDKLMCLTKGSGIEPYPLHKLIADIGFSRSAAIPSPDHRIHHKLGQLLGNIKLNSEPVVRSRVSQRQGDAVVERIVLEVEPGIPIPVLLILPSSAADVKSPIVVALAQEGKAGFFRERYGEILSLLRGGVSICLPDLRGTGETHPDTLRGRQSEITAISSTELMLGQTLLGQRLRDLRSVLLYLRKRIEINTQKVALWGESFALTNLPSFRDPLMDEEESPHQSEPVGGLLALLGALFEENIAAVVARGMIAGYQSVLKDRFCYIPYDVVVPGILTAGDLCDIAATIAPRPLRMEALVDGRNCLMPFDDLQNFFKPALKAYSAYTGRLSLIPEYRDDIVSWFLEWLNKD